MTTLDRAGPKRSPRVVEPTTSQNSAVTRRRSWDTPAARIFWAVSAGGEGGGGSRRSGGRTLISVNFPAANLGFPASDEYTRTAGIADRAGAPSCPTPTDY